jgi:hypothetical protein
MSIELKFIKNLSNCIVQDYKLIVDRYNKVHRELSNTYTKGSVILPLIIQRSTLI